MLRRGHSLSADRRRSDGANRNLRARRTRVKSLVARVNEIVHFRSMAPHSTPDAVLRILAENGLTPQTRLYREAVFMALAPSGAPDVFRVHANSHPAESVVDVYGAGHIVQAESLGKGLAFAQTPTSNWQETMELRAMKGITGAHPEARVEVEITVGDVLAQGGRLYPVESVTVERAWYCTLPIGGIDARIVM